MKEISKGASHDKAQPTDEGNSGVTEKEGKEMATKKPTKSAVVSPATSEQSFPSDQKYLLVVPSCFACFLFRSI